MNKLVVIFASCCAFESFTNARADMGSEPRSVAVYFGDLDTARPQGAAALYGRIEAAARDVCRDLEPNRQLALRQPYKQCIHSAIRNAIAAANLPALATYALARGEALRPNPALADAHTNWVQVVH
jgi:UrcA family protein